MLRMGTASTLARTAFAVLLALLLGVRLLAPAGFMPAFERGSVTIVACPDAYGAFAPAHRHQSGEHESLHQQCPYAAASSLGAMPGDWAPPVALLVFAVALTLGRSFAFVHRRRANERPHSTGPPIPA
jgi:hypothetical protein